MKSGPPLIFNALKRCVESVLHVQFAYEDKSDMVTLQQNGYDCGVHGFRMGEQICFTGENSLIEPFYAEAERARCREILRKLTDNEISDEWVPPVQNVTDFVDLNKPYDTEAITVNELSDDVIEIKNTITDKTFKKNNDTVIIKQNEIEVVDLENDILNLIAGEALNVEPEPQNLNANLFENSYEPIDYKFLLTDLKIVLPTEEYENDEELYLSGDQVMGVIFGAAEFVF
uniref:Uncharacterized protein n=1 Tax=Panagrolaimus superbus TaxID=310955 RepID=A0A914YQK9_9BILA